MAMATQIKLQGLVFQLPADKRDFAMSLAGARCPSEKQVAWIDRLIAMAEGKVEPKPEPTKVEGLGAVVALFDKAAAKLKWPKLTFDQVEVGVELQLSRAGERAKQPGSVNLTDGQPYGFNKWYGRVERDGTFVASRDCPETLVPFLNRLAGDTANVARLYGLRSGHCCFCNTKLTDERSLHAGFGATCAKNWGMPYPTLKEVRSSQAPNLFPAAA
jgi:hypothetical protein